MSDKVISSTTQEFLDVYDIVNDMVLLKDGTAAVILQIGTMNFSLLAEQEQDAVIFTYGSLLNSLNYPIQINIQSQTKDATKYLRLLDEQIKKASSDRKAILIRQYRDFVATLIRERNVLQKRFYIVVPASPGEMGLITPAGVLPGKTTFDITSVEKSILLEKATNLLEPRRDHLTAQFNRLGLFAKQLNTQEIIQNFYINYNPEAAEGQEISSSENYTTPLVRASFGGKFMQLNQQQDNTQPVQSGQVGAQAPATVVEEPVLPVIDTPIQDTQPTQVVQPTQVAQPAPIQNNQPVSSEPLVAETPVVEVQDINANPVPVNPSPEEILGTQNNDLNLTPAPTQAQPEPVMSEPAQEVFVQTPAIDMENNPPNTDQLIFQNQDSQDQNPPAMEVPNESADLQAEIQLGTQVPEPVLDPMPSSTTSQVPTPAQILEPVAPETNPVDTSADPQENNFLENFSEDITPLQNKFETPDQEKTN